MASARASIAELLESGITLTVSEAVAIARAALAFHAPRAADSAAPSGLPLPETILVEADGSIVGPDAAPPTVSEVAQLLHGLLPAGSPGVPGGLRYAIARALGEVDAPPFGSPDDFSIILSRFQTADGPTVVHGMLARLGADEDESLNARKTVERRRPKGDTVTNLRRALREADSQLYERQRSAGAQAPARPRARKAIAIASSFAAAVLLFLAGAATRDQLGTPAPARTEATRAVPAAGDIVLEAPPRKSAVTAAVRAEKPTPRATRGVPAKNTKSRGVLSRLRLQWLKKAFS